MSKEGGGLRHNEGKVRYDLIPAFAQNEYAKVLTKGAEKYEDRNWEKGMPWSKILASLERHLYAIKRGEDYDPETGCLHSAHIMCNAAFLSEYYKIFPQGDDRPLHYLNNKRIGIDIDDVLAEFKGEYCKMHNLAEATSWHFDPKFRERYNSLDDKFFENLKPVLAPSDLPFAPVVYITARYKNLEIPTLKWLFEINNYPVAPVIFTDDKLSVAREYKLDRFIDDKLETFYHLNKNGICCYLFSTTANQNVDVGHKRITKETIYNVL